jgi:hypothetical protein
MEEHGSRDEHWADVVSQWPLTQGVLPAARHLRPGVEQLALQVTL